MNGFHLSIKVFPWFKMKYVFYKINVLLFLFAFSVTFNQERFDKNVLS